MPHPLLAYLRGEHGEIPRGEQAKLADRAGITRPFLSQILHGIRSPSPAVARALSAATGGKVSEHEIAFYNVPGVTPSVRKRSRAA